MAKKNKTPRSQLDSAVVVIVSDLHTNSTVGLPPSLEPFEVDDGGLYAAGKYQRWLWQSWLDFWARIGEVKRASGLPVVTILNGDVFDGDHHDTYQIITKNPEEMLDIGLMALGPARDVSDKMYVLRGTASHVGQQAWLEEALAKRINAGKAQAEGKNRSAYRMLLDIGGFTIDIQHHPESSDVRPWTKGNGANRIANIVMHNYIHAKLWPPNVAVRSHKHVWSESGDNHLTRVYCLPSWQGVTEFVHRIGAGSHPAPSVGGMYFVIRDGQETAHEALRYTPAVPAHITPSVD